MDEGVFPSEPVRLANPLPARRRWKRIPVRWRLTGLYALVLALGLFFFGVVMYAGLRTFFYNALDEQLEDQTSLVLLTIQEQGGNLLLYPRDIGDLESDEHFVRLLDANGRVVTDTSEIDDAAPLDASIVEQAMNGESVITSVSVDDETFRMMSVPVVSSGNVVGVLQVGMSREEIDEALHALLLVLLISGPLVLALATAGGYLLAGRAMSPVSEITRMAASIGADDLDARLNLDLPDDELGQLAKTFDSMLARIEEAFDRQRRFTGDAAHELRTPLSLMRSQVDLALTSQCSNEEYRGSLVALQGEIERVTDIVSALLTLARADAGKLAVSYALVDLAELIDAVIEQFTGEAEAAGIRLAGEVDSSSVEADEDLLLLLLVNLVANAIAATPDGGWVTLGCRSDAADVQLWVTDTGSGVAPEEQQRVFERFYRVDRRSGGAGLGLNIVQSVAAAHEGRISIESEIGQGTTVAVHLPAIRKQPRSGSAR